jgi:hypothetical protein
MARVVSSADATVRGAMYLLNPLRLVDSVFFQSLIAE